MIHTTNTQATEINKKSPRFHTVNLYQGDVSDDWKITNDGVMGGQSKGYVRLHNQTLIFSGDISTENNGGFTSAFTPVANLPQNIKTIRIQIKGDGNSYQLRVRTKLMGFNLAYKVEFMTTANVKDTLSFNLSDFTATFRGRMIGNAPMLKSNEITHLGFLISAKQPKEFALSILSVDFIP